MKKAYESNKKEIIVFFLYFTIMLNFYTYTYIQLVAQLLFLIYVFIRNRVKIYSSKLVSRYLGWYGIFTVWSTVTLFWTVEITPNVQRELLTMLRIFVIGYCFLLMMNNKGSLYNISRGLTYAGIVFSVLTLINNPISQWGKRGMNSIGNGFISPGIGEIGLFLVVSVFLWYKLGYIRKNKTIILELYFTIFVVLSGARKPILEIIIFAVIYNLIDGRCKINRKVMITFFVGIVVGMICLATPDLYEKYLSRFVSIFYGVNSSDPSTIGRFTYIAVALEIAKNDFLFGQGGDAFRNYLANNIVMSNAGILSPTYSHCNYTEILDSFGLIGILIFYRYHWKLLKENWKYIKINDISKYLASMVIMILIGDIGTIEYTTSMVMYFYIILLYVSFINIDKRKNE